MMILNWRNTYHERLTDPETVLARIRPGSRIFIGSSCGEPHLLVETLINDASNLADAEIIHFLDLDPAPYTQSTMKIPPHRTIYRCQQPEKPL